MPRKDKKKKSKGKKGLSTADILKLLKKLKPQTQQVVRVNVGDSDKKKKKGDVQSSYNPPFVFPQQGFPAITSLGQPPFRPPPIEEPRQTITYNAQPKKIEKEIFPPQPFLRREISAEPAPRNKPSTPRIEDISESEFSDIEITQKMPRKSQGYTVRQPYKSKNVELLGESSNYTFQAPKIMIPSNLSATSSQPSYFNLPVQNDKFQADIIRTDSAGDQIGTLSNKVPSSEWTGSPEGDIEITPEERQAANELISQELNQPISVSDVFIEEPTFEELQQQQLQKQQEQLQQQEGFEIEIPVKQKKGSIPVQGVPAPEKEVKIETGVKSIAARALIDEINKAVRENEFVITGIPAQYISSKKPTKGQIKQDSKNKIMSDDIRPVYQEMLKFTGQASKKPPFIIKKPEE
jgi:hypothetical protein